MMKKIYLLYMSFISFNFFPRILFAKSDFFQAGIDLFQKKKFEDAKFKFEQDIVLNPKNEQSYLYLSKIFNKQDKKNLEEQNFKHSNVIKSKKRRGNFQSCKIKTIKF